MHALFAVFGIMPTARPTLEEMVRFEIDYTFWLNVAFGALALALVGLHLQGKHRKGGGHGEGTEATELRHASHGA